MRRWSLLFLFAAFTPVAQAEVIQVGSDELRTLLRQGMTIVDVRTAGEWRQTGVVEGSQMITLFDEQGRADPVAWMQQVDKLGDAARPLILICRSGNRSGKAAQLLDQKYPQRRIYNVREGITGWLRGGQPAISVDQNLKRAGVRCSPAC